MSELSANPNSIADKTKASSSDKNEKEIESTALDSSTENVIEQIAEVEIAPRNDLKESTSNESVSMKKNEVNITVDDSSQPLAGMDTVDLEIDNNNIGDALNEKHSAESKVKKICFREKEFKIRPSLLTTLYETEARVVYNVTLAVFFLVISAILVQDFFNTGNPLHHFWLISWNFAQLPSTMCCWGLMFASTVVFPYYGLTLWSRMPSENVSMGTKVALGIGYVCYILSLFYYPLKFLFYWKLNCACSFIITCENTRLAMKSHSFIRENFERAIRRKKRLTVCEEKIPPSSETSNTEWPSIEQFVYYMFCPSFLYRDYYPRIEKRSWALVLRYGIQCLVSIYMLNIAFILVVYPVFSSMDYEHGVPLGVLAFSAFQCMVAGIMSMFAIFYGLLHSWMNMFAEAMRFGDRCFYLNWWSSKNMADYYRKWNIIVHEWLYVYIYRDLTLILGEKWGPKISQIVVFFLSAAFHEYWFGVSLRILYPVIFVMYFVFGGAFFLLAGNMKNAHVANTIMWFNLIFGTGVFYASYGPEYYARQRCPRIYESDFTDFIVPRIWSCIKA